MKQNKSVQIIFLSLILTCFFLSGEVFAYKESDLKKLKSTKSCPRCDLRNVNLSYADLTGSDLSGANLTGANLTGANLSGARFTSISGRADLSGANLTGANLSKSILSGVNLKNANLKNANLRGANLSDANLRGTDLSGADPRGANLSHATLIGAKVVCDYLPPGEGMTGCRDLLRQKLRQEKIIKREKIRKAKQKLALQKKKEKQALTLQKKKEKERKERLDRPMTELGEFYKGYVILTQCYEVRKGYALVHVNSVEMKNIKSTVKSIENGILGKYPKLEPKKDEIWDKFTKKLAGTITSDFSSWNKYMCDSWKSVYVKLINSYGGGSKIEKDF